MWKYVTKTVKDVFEKGNGLWYCRSINVQDHQSFDNTILNDALHSRPKQNVGCPAGGSENNHKESCKDNFDCSYYSTRNIFKALTCSTAMALGWSASHYLRLRETFKFKESSNRPEKYNLKERLVPYNLLLSHFVWAQPLTLKQINLTEESTSQIQQSTPVQQKEQQTRAIEEAAEKLAFVTGKLENELGAAYLQQSQASTGVEHFEAGALYRNASAAFNLGLCYELGVGTTQDYQKAADCYQVASELGHTRAMYNLAIYYINGRGGLSVDFNQARLLFLAAAKKGHKESKAALGSECSAVFNNETEIHSATNCSNEFSQNLNNLDYVNYVPKMNLSH